MALETAFFDPFIFDVSSLSKPPSPTCAPPALVPHAASPQLFDLERFSLGNTTTKPLPHNSTVMPVPVRCPVSIRSFGDDYMAFRYVVDVYLVPFVIVFGAIGNAVSFCVLAEMREAGTAVVLRALAVMDTAYLIDCFFFQTLDTLFSYDDHFAEMFWTFLPYCKAHVVWPLANTVQTACVWLVLLVTAERYYAILKPLNAKLVLTKRHNQLWILFICALAIVFNSPCHLDLRVVAMPTERCPGLRHREAVAVSLIMNYYYNLLYKTSACLLLRSVGPILVLAFLNAMLVREIHKSKSSGLQTNAPTTSRSRSSSCHMTRIVALVVGTFIVCQLPDVIFRILRTVKMYNGGFSMSWEAYAYLATVCNVFVTINSSTNFLLYCMSGQKFRSILKKKFSGMRRKIVHVGTPTSNLMSSTYGPSITCAKPSKANMPRV